MMRIRRSGGYRMPPILYSHHFSQDEVAVKMRWWRILLQFKAPWIDRSQAAAAAVTVTAIT